MIKCKYRSAYMVLMGHVTNSDSFIHCVMLTHFFLSMKNIKKYLAASQSLQIQHLTKNYKRELI